MHSTRPADQPTTAAKLQEVRQYLSNLDPELLTESLANHYAGQASKSAEIRRANLAQLLPHLNDKLEDEVKALLSLQRSIQEEDETNAKERALGRAFNAQRRRDERQLIMFNLELLRLNPTPEGLTEQELRHHQEITTETMNRLTEALENLRTRGKLVEPETFDKKQTIAPRRNLRREEAIRRTEMIRELTQFCELVEQVVAGKKIVDDATMAELIDRAQAYLSPDEHIKEYSETEDYRSTRRLIDNSSSHEKKIALRVEAEDRYDGMDWSNPYEKKPDAPKKEPSAIYVDGGNIPNPKLYPPKPKGQDP